MDHHRLQVNFFALAAASVTPIYLTQPVLPFLQKAFAAVDLNGSLDLTGFNHYGVDTLSRYGWRLHPPGIRV